MLNIKELKPLKVNESSVHQFSVMEMNFSYYIENNVYCNEKTCKDEVVYYST